MLGKFDARNFTRSTRNLHLGMLTFRVGSFQFHQFHNFDVAGAALWGRVFVLLSATWVVMQGVVVKPCPRLFVRMFVYRWFLLSLPRVCEGGRTCVANLAC